MATDVHTIVLDGVTPIELDQTYTWQDGRLDFLGITFPDDGTDHRLDFTMQGDWLIRHLRLADFGVSSRFTESGDGLERRIDWLWLGDGGAQVVLGETRVRHITAFDTESNAITLGIRRTTSVELFEGNDTVIGGSGRVTTIDMGGGNNRFTAGTGRVEALIMGDGNDRITMGEGAAIGWVRLYDGRDSLTMTGDARIENLRSDGGVKTFDLSGTAMIEQAMMAGGQMRLTLSDAARISMLKTDAGDLRLTTGAGHVDALVAHETTVDLRIGTGGIGQISLIGTTGATQKITSKGWVGALVATGPDGVDLVLKGGAESIRTGLGGDFVRTNAEYVGTIRTMDGDDLVRLGTGGAGLVDLGDGHDTLATAGLEPLASVRISGGNGSDTLDLSRARVALDVSLSASGYQQIVPEGKDSRGWFWLDGFEHLTGSGKADRLVGNQEGNVLRGGGGKDSLFGMDGDDTLIGGKGNDVLTGGWGADVFRFARGHGDDVITDFEIGMDVLQFGNASRLRDISFVAQGDDVLLRVGDGTVLVQNVALDDLRDADNFLF